MQLRQRLAHGAIPMASGAQFVPEHPRVASCNAYSVVGSYRTLYILCEYSYIDADARPPTRVGLPWELWD